MAGKNMIFMDTDQNEQEQLLVLSSNNVLNNYRCPRHSDPMNSNNERSVIRNCRFTAMESEKTEMLNHPGDCRWSSTKKANKILAVYGLEHLSINCDMVFDLFCLFGNVVKVKILKSKMALVEMETLESADECIEKLHKLPLDQDRKIEVKYSKHYSIYNEVSKSSKLLDGTYAHKIYSMSKLNRFTRTSHISNRRPTAPSKILHFFNAPTDITGLDVHQAISNYLDSNEPIISITILPKTQKAKCSTGLIEFNDIAHAVKAVLKSNHLLMKSSKSKYPFLMKLCFSNYYEIKQISNNNSSSNVKTPLLQCRSMRCTPWFLHNSEQATATTLFSISWIKVVNDNTPWTLRQVVESCEHKPLLTKDEITTNIRSEVLDMLKNKILEQNNDPRDNMDDKGDNVDHVEHSDVNKIGPLGDA